MEKKQALAGSKKNQDRFPDFYACLADGGGLWRAVMAALREHSGKYGFVWTETPMIQLCANPATTVGNASQRVRLAVENGGKTWAVRADLISPLFELIAASPSKSTDAQLTKWACAGLAVTNEGGALGGDYQFALEVWGGHLSHLAEAQVMGAFWQFLNSLNVGEVVFEVNTSGNQTSQDHYLSQLRVYLKGKRYELCDSCAEAASVNPLEVLRCQRLDCQAAVAEGPTILDYLDEAAKKNFTGLLEALEELQISYQLSPLLVGGSATGTVAAFKLKVGERMRTIARAESHSQLLQKMGVRSAAAFGVSGSLTKLHEALVERGSEPKIAAAKAEVYLVPLGELAAKRSLRLFRDLVESGVRVFDHFGYTGIKNQLKAAQDAGSPIALIMGQKEALDEVVILRDVKSGMQEVFSYDKIIGEVAKRLGR